MLPNKIFAGEIHYCRIAVEHWEHRIRMAKSLGLNCLSVYIMWNFHETEKGVFDFTTQNKNLHLFLSLAQKHNMLVLIRPGPYVCAEWDLGGLPPRLLAIKDLQLRANNSLYLDEVTLYFQTLAPILQKHIRNNNSGSIVLLQIENQYGFYGEDKSYMEALKQIWDKLSINIPYYYCDWIQNITKCHWKNANIGLNNGIVQTEYQFVRQFEPTGYLFGGEIYSGWFTHWSQKWGGKTIQNVIKEYQFLLANGHSFAMYMVHGGTNFGLTSGANSFKNEVYDYRSHITSYDYDAPINQLGQPTPKYTQLKQLLRKYVEWQVPPIPDPLPVVTFPIPKLQPYATLLNNLPLPAIKLSPQLFAFQSAQLQMFNQGIVVYECEVGKTILDMKIVVHDCGYVFLNGKFIQFLDRSTRTQHQLVLECGLQSNRVVIMVEAMGHINFDKEMLADRKGLIKVEEKSGYGFKWNMYKFPLTYSALASYTKYTPDYSPYLSKANFQLTTLGDTYLNLEKYRKGYLWINGRNLGRYWSQVGPQTKLYCPSSWLKIGNNQIIVLEMLSSISEEVTSDIQLQ